MKFVQIKIMIISLLGYMGSGKTHISKHLSQILNFEQIDLDKLISWKNKMSIEEIFENRGELFFRRQERETLEEILATKKNCVLSLGGGTPAYYNNMDVINLNSISFFLRTSIPELVERLSRQKQKRPLISKISDEDLPEFIAKHLFERNLYYNKARHILETSNKSPEMISKEILDILKSEY